MDDALHVNAGRDGCGRDRCRRAGTRCSTSATVTLPAVAIIGLKLRAVLRIDEIAFRVALPGVDEREVGDQAALHDIGLAVELAHLLALGDHGADAGLGEEGRDAGAAGADALGERALRVEFDLELAGEDMLREHLVLADIGRDHLLDLPGLEQQAEAAAVDARIVGDDGQILDAGIADRHGSGSRECRTGRSRRP